MNQHQNKRLVFILIGLLDSLLGAGTLLIYFGLLPIDIDALGIPRWIVGVIGAVWFFSGILVLAFQLMKTDITE
jgi:hypothetical protein